MPRAPLCRAGSFVVWLNRPPLLGTDISFLFGYLQLFGVGLAQNSFYKCMRWLVRAPLSPPYPTPHHNTYATLLPPSSSHPPSAGEDERQGGAKALCSAKPPAHCGRSRLGTPVGWNHPSAGPGEHLALPTSTQSADLSPSLKEA